MNELLDYQQLLVRAEFLNSEATRLFQTGVYSTGMQVLLKAQTIINQLSNVYDKDRRN